MYDEKKLGILTDKLEFYQCNRTGHLSLADKLIEKFKLSDNDKYAFSFDTIQKYGFISIHYQDGYYWFNFDPEKIKAKQIVWIFENYKGLFREDETMALSFARSSELYEVLLHFLENDYLAK